MGSAIRIFIAVLVALVFADLAYVHGKAVGEVRIESVLGPSLYQCNKLIDKLMMKERKQQ